MAMSRGTTDKEGFLSFISHSHPKLLSFISRFSLHILGDLKLKGAYPQVIL
jgi:hypothetical protein